MKRIICKLLLFAFICAIIDFAFGKIVNYMLDNSKTGSIQKTNYICNLSSEKILIFGSSRGAHHYVPQIIQDSLNITCYNCAYDGCGSITAYGLLTMVLERYQPQIIIYDVAPVFDYFKYDKDNMKYLGPLKGYYDREGIDSIFLKVSSDSKLKMKSQLFRYNSKFNEILSSFRGKGVMYKDGYMPKNKKMEKEPQILVRDEQQLIFDSLKVECFERIAQICQKRNVKLIYYASPCYKMPNDKEFKFAKKVACKYGHKYINHFTDSSFIFNRNYFYDRVHMNNQGATEYSKMVAHELKGMLQKK